MKRSLLTAAIMLAAGSLCAAPALNSYFSNGMVFQQNKPITIWGTADANEDVKVKFAGKTQSVKADKKGNWEVKFDAMKGSDKALTLEVGETKLKDIVIGEVWFTSGQSNMDITFRGWSKSPLTNKPYELEGMDIAEKFLAANPGSIRFCKVPCKESQQPALDADCAKWLIVDAKNLGNVSGVGMFFAMKLYENLRIPVGIVNSSWGGRGIASFLKPENIRKRGVNYAPWDFWQCIPFGCYNKMVYPMHKANYAGFLWYQGCANAWKADANYQKEMDALAEGWREIWGDKKNEMPFYFVQLTGFKDLSKKENGGNQEDLNAIKGDRWSRIRELQRLSASSIPNSFMAVAADVGSSQDIHPLNKFDVGNRLAAIALARHYKTWKGEYSGPLYKSVKFEGGKAILTFDHVGKGLMAGSKKGLDPVKAAKGNLKYFQIAGSDKKFHPATAVISGDKVEVSSPDVAEPAAVRYASQSMLDGCNFYNKDGFPAAPFRTDKW